MTEPDRIDIARLECLASELPRLPGTGSTVLSVDFDFFIRLPTADDLPGAVRDAAIDALDWTGDERVDAETAHAQWVERAGDLRALGLEPERVIGLDRATPPEALCDAITMRFDLPSVLHVADSHAWGLLVILRAVRAHGGPIDLISFDAHHDLGYINDDTDTPARSRARRLRTACADDWAAVALSRGWVRRMTVVYPDWLGDFEWRSEPPTLGRAALGRVTVTTWSAWRARDIPAPVPVIGAIAVRSSEWVPPWGGHDDAFLAMVDRLTPAAQWLDAINPDLRVGAHRADIPRAGVA